MKSLAMATFLLCAQQAYGQALMGTTGLLHMPTADMQADKTFMFGANYLKNHVTSRHFWKKEVDHTYNYYFNITLFPWLEVGYTCTLVWASHGSSYFPESAWGKYANQDRSFYGRVRVWKEGWWKNWTPQIVLGADDPGTHSHYGGGNITSGGGKGNNNYLTRFYLAVTKHVEFQDVGNLGVHGTFIVGRSMSDPNYKRPAAGANFRFQLPEDELWKKVVNGINLMVEYCPSTAKWKVENTWNVGGEYRLWKDRINLFAEYNDGQYLSGGVYCRMVLK